MNWGDIRAAVYREFPRTDMDAINDAIRQAYDAILSDRDWQGLKRTYTLQTIAAYQTGTVAVTQGSAAITGTGTTWSSAPGTEVREIQIGGRQEFYYFSRLSATTGTLDRPYEGSTQTGLGYLLVKREYELPASVRFIRNVFNPSISRDPLPTKSRADLLAAGLILGSPLMWAQGSDSWTDADYPRILLHYAPDAIYSVLVDYTSDAVAFDGRDTNSAPFGWVSPWAIVNGAMATLHKPGSAEAQACAKKAAGFLLAMHGEENKRVPPTPITPSRRYTAVDRMRRQW